MKKFIIFSLLALLFVGCNTHVADAGQTIVKAELSNSSFWKKVGDGLAKGITFTNTTIQTAFDRTLGKLDFSSRWWLLFYLGGLLIISVGLKTFPPLCWIGVIMQYAYLQYMSPPFFMLWPSLVGWGWMILSLIPMVMVISMNAVLCVCVILSTFTNGFVNFLIMLIPAIIAVLSLIALVHIAFTDHLELILFLILGAVGGGKKFVGTFTDANGNSWDVYR